MKISELFESNSRKVTVHDFTKEYDIGGSAAYDRTQTDENIEDGDVFHLGDDRTAIMVQAWPVMATGKFKSGIGFHTLKTGFTWDDFDGGKYASSFAKAKEIAKNKK